MSRRTLAIAAALVSACASNHALAITQWNFEDGTSQQWGNSFGTPWINPHVSNFAATDGGLGYSFNIPNQFTFGGESNTRPPNFGAETPAEGARWDAFVASNLLLVDFSANGTKPAATDASPTLQGQYVSILAALNGPKEAAGQTTGNAFIQSDQRPIDPESGASARYQTNFSPGYFTGQRSHTFAWDYVNAGFDFSKLVPTNNSQNYTLLHFTTNTDAVNPYAGLIGFDNIRVYRAKMSDPTYTGSAEGGSFAASNFANGFVSGSGAIAIFRKIAGADTATVTLPGAVTVGTLMLNNAPRTAQDAIGLGNPTSYTFAGASTLTLNAGAAEAAIVCIDGDNVITAPLSIQSNAVIDLAADPSQDGAPLAPATLSVANVTLAAGKALRTTSIGTLTINGNLAGGAGSSFSVNGGTTVVASSGTRLLSVGALSVASSAKLDLTNNAAIVDYTGASTFAALQASIISGFANGTQTGNGIVSSAADSKTALGIIEASSILPSGGVFRGQTVDSTAVLIRFTYRGDFDLSGVVTFDDLLSLAKNYGTTGKTWRDGDTNYNGIVDFDDLLALASNYQKPALSAAQSAAFSDTFLADFALAQALVPEPGTLTSLGLLAVALKRRRAR